MRATRRRAASVLVATLLLGLGTVTLASFPPRPLRSVLTLVHTLGLRVASDWLAVVALLSLGERIASDGDPITRRTVQRLALAVFVGGFAIELSPLARLVAEPAAVETGVLVGEVGNALQASLFASGLFAATAVGGATLRDSLGDRATGGLPLASSDQLFPRIGPRALGQVARVLAVVAVLWLSIEVTTRLVLGVPYVWLAVVDSAVAALSGAVDYAVLALGFLALAVDGTDVRSVAATTAVVWLVLVVLGIAVALLSAGLGVLLVGATATPMGAVEAAGMGLWPEPDSWTHLLATGSFLAGAVGLSIVQRTTPAVDDSDASTPVDESGTPR
jgi:hypothetical protein